MKTENQIIIDLIKELIEDGTKITIQEGKDRTNSPDIEDEQTESEVQNIPEETNELIIQIENLQTQIQQLAQIKNLKQETEKADVLPDLIKELLQKQNEEYITSVNQLRENLSTISSNIEDLQKNIQKLSTPTEQIQEIYQHLKNEIEELKNIKNELLEKPTQNQQEDLQESALALYQQLKEDNENIKQIQQDLEQEISNFKYQKQSLYQQKNQLNKEEEKFKKLTEEFKKSQKSASQNKTTQTLKKYLFADERKIHTYLPQSFICQNEIAQKGHSFFWIGEKMGMVYLAVIDCGKDPKNQEHTALMMNTFLNHFILESRMRMDTEQVIEQLNFQIEEIQQDTEACLSNDIRVGLIALDSLNANIDFSGIGADLVIQSSKKLQHIEGQDLRIGKITSNQKIAKKNIPIIKGTNFFLIMDEDGVLSKPICETLKPQKNAIFSDQQGFLQSLLKDEKKKRELIFAFRI
jgi:small-conductance mechanosensitive channel